MITQSDVARTTFTWEATTLRRHCLKSDQSSETLIVGPEKPFQCLPRPYYGLQGYDISLKPHLFLASDVLLTSLEFIGTFLNRFAVLLVLEGCMHSLFVYTFAVHPTAAFIEVPKSCERRLSKEKLYCWGTSSSYVAVKVDHSLSLPLVQSCSRMLLDSYRRLYPV